MILIARSRAVGTPAAISFGTSRRTLIAMRGGHEDHEARPLPLIVPVSSDFVVGDMRGANGRMTVRVVDDVVGQDAESLDLDLDHVTWLQQPRGRASVADTRRACPWQGGRQG